MDSLKPEPSTEDHPDIHMSVPTLPSRNKDILTKFYRIETHWFHILNFMEIFKIANLQLVSKRFQDTFISKF